MLLLEGIIPLLLPRQWREVLDRITCFSDGRIRFFGLISLLCGLATIGLAHFFS
jgi:uncharacterized protein YjeT (DUF2065 family)